MKARMGFRTSSRTGTATRPNSTECVVRRFMLPVYLSVRHASFVTSPMNLRAIAGFLALFFSLAATPALPSDAGAQAVVAQLYRDFAWEAVVDKPEWPGHSLLEQPRQVLARYFDENLAALILKDRSCVAKTHEICRLDFSPMWASQDPGASELKVSPTKDPGVVAVKFRYPGNGSIIELSYRMSKTRIGWRVHDILYSSGSSLLSVLGSKP